MTEKTATNRLSGITNGKANGAAPQPPRENRVLLVKPKIETARFVIKGITPLVHNNFNNRAKESMLAKQLGTVVPRGFRVPQVEFFDSLYITPDQRQFYLKPNAFKRAICDASRLVDGVSGTLLGQALHVVDPFVIVHGSLPRMIEPVHRIGKWPNQTAIIQYRAQFDRWCCSLEIRWLASEFTVEQVGYLLMYAGMGGVGDCRPNSKMNRGGTNGQFELVGTVDEPAAKKLLGEYLTDPKVSEKWVREQTKEAEEAAAKAIESLKKPDAASRKATKTKEKAK